MWFRGRTSHETLRTHLRCFNKWLINSHHMSDVQLEPNTLTSGKQHLCILCVWVNVKMLHKEFKLLIKYIIQYLTNRKALKCSLTLKSISRIQTEIDSGFTYNINIKQLCTIWSVIFLPTVPLYILFRKMIQKCGHPVIHTDRVHHSSHLNLFRQIW